MPTALSPVAFRSSINPALFDSANDNRPLGRHGPAKRSLTLKGLLGWTYRQQQAHRILRKGIDWFLWAMDAAGYIDVPHDRRQVHHDAAVVHEAVLGLGEDMAELVIEMASTGLWPEPIEDIESRAYPMEPSDRFDEFGRHVRGDGTRFQYLITTVDIVSVPREEYELVGRRKMRRAKADSWDRVPVRFCPIRWNPNPDAIEEERRRAALWDEASQDLEAVLAGATFRDHALRGVAPLADNDNDLLTSAPQDLTLRTSA